jgi:hypothetical protein
MVKKSVEFLARERLLRQDKGVGGHGEDAQDGGYGGHGDGDDIGVQQLGAGLEQAAVSRKGERGGEKGESAVGEAFRGGNGNGEHQEDRHHGQDGNHRQDNAKQRVCTRLYTVYFEKIAGFFGLSGQGKHSFLLF